MSKEERKLVRVINVENDIVRFVTPEVANDPKALRKQGFVIAEIQPPEPQKPNKKKENIEAPEIKLDLQPSESLHWMKVKSAINKMDSEAEIMAFTAGDSRAPIQKAVQERLKELA